MEKYPGESALFNIDCSQLLGSAETITGTPAMSFLPALTGDDALVIGTPIVNAAAQTLDDGRTVAAGKVIQVRVSGGTVAATQAKRTYSVIATLGTSDGNTLVARALLDVLQVTP